MKKRKLGLFIPLLLMPALLWVSSIVLKEQYYAVCSMLFAILSCIFVMLIFDRHSTNIRLTILIAVMTTISVLSRFFFAMVPGFKPMTAIIVLTAIYLGPEAGFFCGAFTALVSNMYFGQGPWTPFQMLSYGLIGLLAGVLSKSLKKNKILLVGYGVFAGVMYSFVMDVWTVLWYRSGFQLKLYLAALLTAVPYTLSYAISNAIFLLVFTKAFTRKIERIVYKVGI